MSGLQNLTIIVAAPFAVVMIGLCWSLWRDLRTDPLVLQENAMLKAMRDDYEAGDGRSRRHRVGRK